MQAPPGSPPERSLDSRFEIGARIGRGSFGEVYRAVERATGRVVAVKRLLEGSSDASAARRFELESRLIARVEHPNVVGYVGHGIDEGRPWLALEWLEGQDLSKRRKAGHVEIGDAVEIVCGAAAGLHALHAAGIVHRDVKPANIFLLAEVEGPARVKLVDLGIARADNESTLTLDGFRVGTPAYMSPEQARGDAVITTRSDIYSLGVVLFELLAGRRPFMGEPFALLAKILLEQPPRLREVAPGLSAGLEAVVSRAMARRLEDRYANVDEFASALRAARPDQAIAADAFDDISADPTFVGEPIRHRSSEGSGVEHRVVTSVFAWFGSDTGAHARGRDFTTVCERHQGAVHEMIGGRAVAVFGLTRSSGDEVVRAARAALEARSLIPGIRLAIATSRVLASAIGPTGVTGAAIDRGVAAVESAQSGVRVDTASARLLESHFDVSGPPGDQILTGETASRRAGRVPLLLGRETTTVGRKKEIGMLGSIYDECVEDSVAHAIVVTAEPGLGKTRVVHEFLQGCALRDEPPAVWIARADPMSVGSPLGMLRQLIKSATGLTDGESLAERRAGFRTRVARHVRAADQARVQEFLGEIAGFPVFDTESDSLRAARLDPIVMGDQMRHAFQSWLGAECAACPVVVVMENLQWGDQPSVSFFDDALRNLANARLVVIAVARPEVSDVLPDLWSRRRLTSIELRGLSRAASEALVRESLGTLADAPTAERIVERAAGNAFFLEELIRAVAENRGEELPDTVLAMLQSRLDALDDRTRNTLRAASVFGTTFWRGAVESATEGTLTPDLVALGIQDLEREEMILARTPASFPGESEYLFRNSLFRDAAYASLPEVASAEAHRRAGEWLARSGATDAIALAGHFERGGDPARALRWHKRAAQLALEGNDFAAVLAHCDKALAAADRSGAPESARGELRLLQIYARAWRHETLELAAASRDALAELAPGTAGWYEAAGFAALAAIRRADAATVLALVTQLHAAPALADATGPRVAALSRVILALLEVGLGAEGEEQFPLLVRAIEAAGSLEPRVQARVHEVRARRADLANDPEVVLRELQLSVACFEAAGDLRSAARASLNVGNSLASFGAYERAIASLDQTCVTADRMALVTVAAAGRLNGGLPLARLGRTAEARESGEAALAFYTARHDLRMAFGARNSLAMIHLEAGDIPRAREIIAPAVATSEAFPVQRAYALGVLATILIAESQFEEALATASGAVDMLDRSHTWEEGEFIARLAQCEALEALGRHADARHSLAGAYDRLAARVSRIADLELRASLRDKIPEHARIVALARDWLGMPTHDP